MGVLDGNLLIEEALKDLFSEEIVECPRCGCDELFYIDLEDLIIIRCECCGWSFIDVEEHEYVREEFDKWIGFDRLMDVRFDGELPHL